MEIINDVINIEFLNDIDKIMFELLYSNPNGYINLASRTAIINGEKYIKEFDKELEKLAYGKNNCKLQMVISEKKKEFKEHIKKH